MPDVFGVEFEKMNLVLFLITRMRDCNLVFGMGLKFAVTVVGKEEPKSCPPFLKTLVVVIV